MVTKIPILHAILHSTPNSFPGNSNNTHSYNWRYNIIGSTYFILLLIIDRFYLSPFIKQQNGSAKLNLRNHFIIFLIEFGHGCMHLLTVPKNQALLPEVAVLVAALHHGTKYDFEPLLRVVLK